MEKRINLVEILKDCPRGMELDCVLFDDVKFEECAGDCIYIRLNNGGVFALTKYGNCLEFPISKCVIFPKSKTTWEGFIPPCKFKDGDVLVHTQNDRFVMSIYHNKVSEFLIKTHCILWDKDEGLSLNKEICCYDDYVRLATEGEKQKLFDAIKANGYRWNAETKTLEKLIKPKFKIGDRIRHKIVNFIHVITGIKDEYYIMDEVSFPHGILPIEAQDEYELVPNKFDINILKPFESRVLVRDKNTDEWRGHFFSHYDSNSDRPYVCIGVEGINEYKRCIPYEGNEHLLGKTDDCNSFYKTWE